MLVSVVRLVSSRNVHRVLTHWTDMVMKQEEIVLEEGYVIMVQEPVIASVASSVLDVNIRLL